MFSTLKTALKLNKKFKNTKNCQNLVHGWRYCNILKIPASTGVQQEMIIDFNLY